MPGIPSSGLGRRRRWPGAAAPLRLGGAVPASLSGLGRLGRRGPGPVGQPAGPEGPSPPSRAPGAAGLTFPSPGGGGDTAAQMRPADRSGPPVPPANYFNVGAQRHRVRASCSDRRRRGRGPNPAFQWNFPDGPRGGQAGHQGPFNEFISRIILPAAQGPGDWGKGASAERFRGPLSPLVSAEVRWGDAECREGEKSPSSAGIGEGEADPPLSFSRPPPCHC